MIQEFIKQKYFLLTLSSICAFILLVNYFNINNLVSNTNCLKNDDVKLQVKSLDNVTKSIQEITLNQLIINKSVLAKNNLLIARQKEKSFKQKFLNILDLLPHSKDKTYFEPFIEFTKKRNATFVIGIPTIKREVSYLYETLSSLISSIDFQSDEKNDVLIVVFISEISDKEFVNSTIAKLVEKFEKEIENGFIDILVPPEEYYPNFNETLKKDYIFNDPVSRIQWRTKQNYDISYLMNYCRLRGVYYLQLEDDILAQNGFVTSIKNFLSKLNPKNSTRWAMVEFSELGFIGKLFKSADLPIFINMFLMFSDYKPVDLIHTAVFEILACDPSKSYEACKKNVEAVKIKYRPSLFQHVGLKSSLKGKMQKLKDKYFEEVIKINPHANPEANINTTLKHYQNFGFEKVYLGQSYFWANSPKTNDFLTIQFSSPFLFKRFTIKSGSSLHPDDKIPVNSTLEIKPVQMPNSTFLQTNNLTRKTDDFLVIKKLTDKSGFLIGELSPQMTFNITHLRLIISDPGDKWILISEFGIV